MTLRLHGSLAKLLLGDSAAAINLSGASGAFAVNQGPSPMLTVEPASTAYTTRIRYEFETPMDAATVDLFQALSEGVAANQEYLGGATLSYEFPEGGLIMNETLTQPSHEASYTFLSRYAGTVLGPAATAATIAAGGVAPVFPTAKSAEIASQNPDATKAWMQSKASAPTLDEMDAATQNVVTNYFDVTAESLADQTAEDSIRGLGDASMVITYVQI